LGKRVRLVELT